MSHSAWPVRRALTQPILLMGTEKTLLLSNVLICVVWAFASHATWISWLAIPVFAILHSLSVMVTSHDPCAVNVFKRSNRYRQGYYPPVGGLASVGRDQHVFHSLPYRVGGQQ